jgi:hypothetical protein
MGEYYGVLIYIIVVLVGFTAFLAGNMFGRDERNTERERLHVRKLEALRAGQEEA